MTIKVGRKPAPVVFHLLAALMAALMLQACGSRPYQFKYLAKSQTNLVADAHLMEITRLMKTLMEKLYKRNPDQLAKVPGHRVDQRISQIFGQPGALRFDELNQKEGPDALNLCFDDQYPNDRVFALMVGLVGMIRKSYNDQIEFFMNDFLDQQKLYNSARNIEILTWRLSNRRDSTGRVYLLTNGEQEGVENLSYERIFGKMIALQDMMARIMADTTNRVINRVAVTAATSAFMPVGF